MLDHTHCQWTCYREAKVDLVLARANRDWVKRMQLAGSTDIGLMLCLRGRVSKYAASARARVREGRRNLLPVEC